MFCSLLLTAQRMCARALPEFLYLSLAVILTPRLSRELQLVYDDYSSLTEMICVLIAAPVLSLPTHPPLTSQYHNCFAFTNLSGSFKHLYLLTFIARWYPSPAIVTEHHIDDLTVAFSPAEST